MHGGVKFYRGSAGAARSYVEADRSRADDYYLAEGTGLATRYVATAGWGDVDGDVPGDVPPVVPPRVAEVGTLDGPAYEAWVAGYDVETGLAKGRLRTDGHGLRFVEVVVNGPKTWSLAASLHPQIAAAYDGAQERAAGEVIGWLAGHATTRVGPRGRQVQVPVDRLEAVVVRHYTSRAGDPHRHLHLQVNARVEAGGRWRGLHSVGVVDSIEAVNGIGHAAVACDPTFRRVLAAHGYTLDPATSEITELAPYAGAFSARAAQITRNTDRYEAAWRREHPGEEPGPGLRRAWDRRAWAQARPDKVTPTSGADLAARWRQELRDLGFTPPVPDPALGAGLAGTAIGRVNRDAVADLVLTRLGGRRSAWNGADIHGEVEKIIAGVGVIAAAGVRGELVEDLVARTIDRCLPLLQRGDVPDHVRALTSARVLDVEADLVARLAARAARPAIPDPVGERVGARRLDPGQRRVVAALTGTARLLVIEGAAGAGKTTTMAAAADLLQWQGRRMLVVTPTLKAARVAQAEAGVDAFSAAWLIHQHGHRWDTDGHRWRVPTGQLNPLARLLPGDLLLVDEAGMLDQDTARALLMIADRAGARLALIGDRHQLPAVGRGGVLDHATRWAPPEAHLVLNAIHRFTDPDYAALTLLMRTGQHPERVFDALHERGQVVIHPSDIERVAALAAADALVIADTREQVATLNAAIRDHRHATDTIPAGPTVTTRAGERVSVGDQVATRHNNPDLDVANRDRWTITSIRRDGGLTVHGISGTRHLPASYVHDHVELAYATTVHGAQGDTVDQAHLLLGQSTGAAAAYVAMTRGRQHNTAHLVADTIQDARTQWVDTFARDRADLGPAHAAHHALQDIDRYGPQPRTRSTDRRIPATPRPPRRPDDTPRRTTSPDRSPGIGR